MYVYCFIETYKIQNEIWEAKEGKKKEIKAESPTIDTLHLTPVFSLLPFPSCGSLSVHSALSPGGGSKTGRLRERERARKRKIADIIFIIIGKL